MKLTFLIELSHTLNNSIVTRKEWQARPPRQPLSPLRTPVPYVVVHHSYIPGACYDKGECCMAMRQMQDLHMYKNGWLDIGMNFAIGSDGVAYEGCGWKSIGAHSQFFNIISLGIVLIGNWRNETPPIRQLNTLRVLISSGVEMRYIREDYKLVGHRQVSNTDCPGNSLYNILRSWNHYSDYPHSYKDLINIRELPDSVKQEIAKAPFTDKTYHQVY